MFGGVKWTGWATILVAGGLALGSSVSAQAADFGGDCCADLEERVAELEATTARKGNRKVKLTVYGQVNESLMWWDDGFEENVYIVTNDASRTRFGFKGGAKINGDWSANFRLEIGVRSANSKRSNQDDPRGETGLDLRHAWWNIKSKTYGTFQVGQTPTASQKATEQNLAGTNPVGKYADVEDSGGGMRLRTTDGGFSGEQWRRLIKHSGDPPGEGDRIPAVLYKSPAFAGFSLLAAWGGDDSWDVGMHYKNKIGGFKIKSAVAYAENTARSDANSTFQCVVNDGDESDADCQTVGGSISVMHMKSGLYTNVAAGWLKDNNIDEDFELLANNADIDADDTSTFWAIEAGIQQKWFPVGKTTVFGQYYDYDGGANGRTGIAAGDAINSLGEDADIFSSNVEMWGVGIAQDLSAASMKLYALYRHYEFEATLAEADGGGIGASEPLEDFDVLMTGAIIKF